MTGMYHYCCCFSWLICLPSDWQSPFLCYNLGTGSFSSGGKKSSLDFLRQKHQSPPPPILTPLKEAANLKQPGSPVSHRLFSGEIKSELSEVKINTRALFLSLPLQQLCRSKCVAISAFPKVTCLGKEILAFGELARCLDNPNLCSPRGWTFPTCLPSPW